MTKRGSPDGKFSRARGRAKRQHLTRMAYGQAMEDRMRAEIQQRRAARKAAEEAAATGEGDRSEGV